MQINLKHCPPDMIQKYNLHKKVASDGYFYIKTKKIMYDLKQAAVFAYINLVKKIAPHSYVP